MATQTIEFRSPPSQTITAKLFAVGSDTQVASVTATEATNRKGTYAGAYTDVPAGEYELIALVSTTPVARWFVTLTLTTATFQVYDKSQTVLMVADVMNASALAADAVTEIQSGLATAANVSTVSTQVTAVQTVLSGITSLAHWLRRAFRKDAGSAGMIAAEAEIQTGGTATYLGTTDNLEAIKDAGGGGGSGDASQTTLLAVQVTTTAIAASLAGTPIEVAGRVASGGGITLYIGDDCKVASGTQLTITVSDPAGGLYTILNAIPIANLAWGASRARSAASLIPGTITSLAQSGSGASTLLLISVEIIAAGTASGCVAADDYEYQISSRTNTTDDFVRIEGTLNLLPRRVAIP